MKPVIMTDCDGVLLNWLSRTPDFLLDLGLDSNHLRDAIKGNQFIPFLEVFLAKNDEEAYERLTQYHESDHMKMLPVMEEKSEDVLKRLSKDYDIIVLTSFSNSKKAQKNRAENLALHYGDSIADLICLDVGEDKTPVLKDIAKSRKVEIWLDDQIKHVNHGINAGVKSFQFTFGMDCGRNTGEVEELDSWKAVEKMVKTPENKPTRKRSIRR